MRVSADTAFLIRRKTDVRLAAQEPRRSPQPSWMVHNSATWWSPTTRSVMRARTHSVRPPRQRSKSRCSTSRGKRSARIGRTSCREAIWARRCGEVSALSASATVYQAATWPPTCTAVYRRNGKQCDAMCVSRAGARAAPGAPLEGGREGQGEADLSLSKLIEHDSPVERW